MTKALADESFILASGEIGRNVNRLVYSAHVQLRPRGQAGLTLLVNWQYYQFASEPKIRLWYNFRGESQSYYVGLRPSEAFGGKRIRWRFDCMGCHEQADKLYLPVLAGQRCFFLCRLCWGVDYISHVYPHRAALRTVEILDQKIRRAEADLFNLRTRRNKLERTSRAR